MNGFTFTLHSVDGTSGHVEDKMVTMQVKALVHLDQEPLADGHMKWLAAEVAARSSLRDSAQT